MMSWRDKPVRVTARYIPRYLWTTASIDVFLEDRCILRTGGQLKLTGACSCSFSDGGEEHKVELNWGESLGFRFPYQLRIDDVLLGNSIVKVENRTMIGIPALIVVIFFMVIIGMVLWLRTQS